MLIYFVILAFFLYVAINEVKSTPISNIQLALMLGFLAIFIGLGDMMGGFDRYIYCELFDDTADYLRNGGISYDSIMGYKSEYSYVLWNRLLAHVTENRYIFIMLTTFYIYILLYLSLKDLTEYHAFALILFLGLWMFFTFTYLRQAMATVTIWYAYRFLFRNKRLYFLAFWLVAYGFHNSAIVFLPFVFIPYKKWKPQTVIIVMTISLMIGATGVTSGLYKVFSDTMEDNARSVGYSQDTPGFRTEYLIEVIVFIWLLLKNYDRIDRTNKLQLFLLNCCYMFCIILLFFIHSSNAGRLSWYFMGGLISLFSSMFAKEVLYRKWILILMVGLYLRIVFAWGGLLSPYKTFLTSGNQNELMTNKFEYDFIYENNKFYRKPIDFK